MVDKLEKNGHKRIYYRLKAVVFFLLIALGLTAVMAIPVGISYRLAAEGMKESVSSSDALSLLKAFLPLL